MCSTAFKFMKIDSCNCQFFNSRSPFKIEGPGVGAGGEGDDGLNGTDAAAPGAFVILLYIYVYIYIYVINYIYSTLNLLLQGHV